MFLFLDKYLVTHEAKWRGNRSPYIPRNIILRYSQEGDLVLDQFAGGETTLVEAKLLNRNIIGVDCNDDALKRCKEVVKKRLILNMLMHKAKYLSKKVMLVIYGFGKM